MPFVKFNLHSPSLERLPDQALIINTDCIKSLVSTELRRLNSDGKMESELVLRLTSDIPLTVYDITETADEAYRLIQEALRNTLPPALPPLTDLGRFIEFVCSNINHSIYKCEPASTLLSGALCLPDVIIEAITFADNLSIDVRYSLSHTTDIETKEKKLVVQFHIPKSYPNHYSSTLLKKFDEGWNYENVDRLEYKVSFFTGEPY